jgi:hypothetical protein
VFTYFVTTLVNQYGEESAPSDPSEEIDMYSNVTAQVSRPTASTAHGINKWRVYRANAGTWQFVREAVTATASVDIKRDDPLGEELETIDWDLPPKTLQRLALSPNGFLVGYFDRTVCFSEAYVPHAWPTQYRRNTRHDIMGVTNTSSGVIVITKGKPYVVMGTSPASMQLIEGDSDYGCISADSIVDMGEYTLYASPVGIMAIDSSGKTRNMTEKVWRADQWAQNLTSPRSVRAVRFQSRYIFQFTDDEDGINYVLDTANSTLTILNNETEFKTMAGAHLNSTTRISAIPRGGEYDTEHGCTYFVQNRQVRRIDMARTFATWRSMSFTGAKRINPSWAQVSADNYPVTLSVITVGDSNAGTETHTVTDRKPFRLPAIASGDLKFEVRTQHRVDRVVLTNDESELMAWQ